MTKEQLKLELKDRISQCIRPDGTFDKYGFTDLEHFFIDKYDELLSQYKQQLETQAREAMIKVPPTRDYNIPEDSYFNLGVLKVIELITKGDL